MSQYVQCDLCEIQLPYSSHYATWWSVKGPAKDGEHLLDVDICSDCAKFLKEKLHQ